MIDLRCDEHVHTAFSAGRDSVSVLVAAAERAGMTQMTFADRAGPDSTWLPSYLAAIQRAKQRTDLTLRSGVEVEAIGTDGWVAFPADLGGLEIISVGLNQLPFQTGLAGPEAVRTLIATRSVSASDVVEQCVTVTCRAIERVSRYAPTMLARPLVFLASAGIAESAIGEDAVGCLAETCRACGTVVEISEWYRSPTPGLAMGLMDAGIGMVAASDAKHWPEVGAWDYVSALSVTLAAAADAR